MGITAWPLPILEPRRLPSPFRGFSLHLRYGMLYHGPERQHSGVCPSLPHLGSTAFFAFCTLAHVPSYLRAFACVGSLA